MQRALIIALATLLAGTVAAGAQTPPTDAQSKTKKESPTTMGTGNGSGNMKSEQVPATDPPSKTENESPTTMGAGNGTPAGDPTKTAPATDPQSKDKR
jgi:hypothetical protein